MKQLLLSLIFLVLGATIALASIEGDEVVVQFIDNDIIRETFTVTVTDDDTDSIPIIFGYASLDMGPSGFEMSFSYLVDFEVGNFFSGIKISDLDDSSHTKWILKAVSVNTDNGGWSEDRIEFSEDWVSFSWQGLVFLPGQYFNAVLTFGPKPSISALPAIYHLLLLGDQED